ncbi:MAG: serine hydrolase [Salinivirgaceae bacterium]|nr:serine hydrolase [Salinivirgaceae bacterium]
MNLFIKNLILVALVASFLSACNNKDIEKENNKVEKIEALIKYHHERDGFNGAVLVAQNGQVIYKNALGYENFEDQKKLSTNSVFNIGSVTKQFTAMAIMILKEQGKLSYDDSFSRFYPEFHNAQNFTLRHLLSHTAGVPNYTISSRFPEFRVPGRPGDFLDDITDQDIFDFFKDSDSFDFEAGERCSYSNTGYVLLSLVVENVSGIPFHQFLEKNIFTPLEMNNTLVWNNTKPEIPNKTTGYNEYGDKDDYNILTGGPGGIYTTVEDLFKWDQALYSEKLVTKETLNEALTPGKLKDGSIIKLRPESTSSYGFGWLIQKDSVNNIVSHDGGFNGFSAILYRDLKNKNTIILLSNKGTNGPLYPIQENIIKILNCEEYINSLMPIRVKFKSMIDSMGIMEAIKQFNKIRSLPNSGYSFDVNQLNALGYYYLNNQDIEKSLAIFKINTELFPNDANVFDSYAESLMISGDYQDAILFYKKSLELNPNNENAKNMLTKIEHEKSKIVDDSNLVPGSCTIFSVAVGNKILFGNNEDYKDIPLYYWVRPSTNQTYGGVYFGFENLSAQGGINEKGLVFDYNGLPSQNLNSHPDLPSRGAIMTRIQQSCATVEEAITVAKSYNWGGTLTYQIHLADATGDAVVISAGPDGELAFTRKADGINYLLSTNFNLANTDNSFEDSYPCWRYIRADQKLKEIKNESDLDVNHIRYILDAAHIESGLGNTLYSYICDLVNGKIYLYYWHQFEEVAILDVAEEIKKNSDPTLIKTLFSKELIDKTRKELEQYQNEGIK